tara:strand:+ start:2963 stop:3397 length:435 start_codon:yes stop_codon:yes gene_type:complete
MSELHNRNKVDHDVLSGRAKIDEEVEPKRKKKPLCTGNRCAKITMALGAAVAALTQLNHILPENAPPQSSVESMTKPELWKKIHEVSNVSHALRKEIEDLKKALKKSEDDKKALVQTHNQKGVMGAVKDGISNFVWGKSTSHRV